MMGDAWVAADPTACPICGKDSCDEPDHLPPPVDEAAAATPPTNPYQVKLSTAVEAERVRREARRILDAEERPPILIPPFETLAARLLHPTATYTDWRIAGWQGRNHRVMCAAQFKAGKTTLRDNYIRSKVDGDLFLGYATVTPITGSLVLIDTEMSEPQLEAWLRAQGIKAADRVWPIALRGQVSRFNLLDADVRREWAERLRAVTADDFVLDCLRPVLDALGLDEQREAGRFLVALDALLIEAGIPEALVIQHMGHGAERARGDSRLRDWPDVEWRLIRRDDDPASPRYITAYGRDVDVPEGRLTFDPTTRHLTLAGGSRHDEKTRTALAAVLELLAGESKGLSGRGIKDVIKESGAEHARDDIDAALRLGLREGQLLHSTGPKKAKLYRANPHVSGVSGCVRAANPDT
jgi:hypothetical protein